MWVRMGGGGIDADSPRVADTNRKQQQHGDSHQGEPALGVVKEQDPARYNEPVRRKRQSRVSDLVMQIVVTTFVDPNLPGVTDSQVDHRASTSRDELGHERQPGGEAQVLR
jgi:hypothetical protein